MKSELQCVPCALQQALRSLRLATEDVRNSALREEVRDKALRLSLGELSSFSLKENPAELSTKAIRAALSSLGAEDPYEKLKEEHTQLALSLYDKLKAIVRRSEDSLRGALRLAACGNVIDLGTADSFDLMGEIKRALSSDFALDDYSEFVQRLRQAESVLYLADNAGEIVLDRLVLEQIEPQVTLAVKSGPILNDATAKDALSSGVPDNVSLITTGTDELGVPLKRCSAEFRESFRTSDIVVAKGHANFESLDEQPKEVFFLLKAKCEVVARRLGVEVGETVFTRTQSRQ